jgi:hypothetical protein
MQGFAAARSINPSSSLTDAVVGTNLACFLAMDYSAHTSFPSPSSATFVQPAPEVAPNAE